MPLDKMEIRVPFGGGIDTKTDHKQVIPGKLLELKNGTFQNLKQITKREAFEAAFSTESLDSGDIIAGNAIYRRGKEILITGRQDNAAGRIGIEDGNKMFSHGPDEDEWKTIGDRDPIRLEVESVAAPHPYWECPDVALADSGKYIGYVYLSQSDPGYVSGATEYARAHLTIKEIATDVTWIDDYVYTAAPMATNNVGGVHITGIGTKFYIWLAIPGINDIYVSVVDTANLGAAITASIICDDLHGDMIWDVCTATNDPAGECTVLAYKESAAGFPEIRWVNATPGTEQIRIGTEVIKNAITVYEEYDRETTSLKVLSAYQMNADGHIEGVTFNDDDTLYTGWNYTIYNADAGVVLKMTGCKDEGSDDTNWPASLVRLYIGIRDANPLWWAAFVRTVEYEFDGTNPAELAMILHANLISKAWNYENKPHVWVTHDSSGMLYEQEEPDFDVYSQTVQNTLFLRSPGDNNNYGEHHRTDARCLGGEAGVIRTQHLSAVVSPETNKHLFATKRQEKVTYRLPPNQDQIFSPESLDSIVHVAALFGQYAQPSTELGPCVQTGGGFIGCADGRFQELGFHLYPMIIEIVASGGSGAATTWQYCAVYEWMDREGQRHQSAPSLPVEIECKVDDHVRVEVMTLTYGDYEKLENTNIILYRTEDDGPVFYRLPEHCTTPNQPTIFTTFCYDQSPTPATAALSDALLVYGETIYTGSLVNGVWDVVENICPPASSIMKVRQDRVFLVPDEDRENIWFSKLKQYEVGTSFSGAFTKRVTDGGEIKALETMDTRLVVFKEAEIRAFSGPGPIDTGVGSFGEDYLITADVGCCDRASVVWTDKGIMFKSLKGIYLLGRNLQVTYIGAPVEEYNQYTVLKAELVETKNQVRFLLAGSPAMLVYDYLVDQWSVFDSPFFVDEVQVPWGTVDSAMWQNQFVMVRDDGMVLLETANYRDVATTYIPLDLTTAWIKLNGLQGYQRVWWISLLGEVYDYCTLNYEIYYDYVDANPQTGTININAAFAANPPAQFRIKPRYGNGKCQAFKLRLYDATATGATTYKGFAISDLMIQIGKKKGVMRQGFVKTR